MSTTMVTNLKRLSESIDLATTDRRLADKIRAAWPEIQRAVAKDGQYIVRVDGKQFRITITRKKE